MKKKMIGAVAVAAFLCGCGANTTTQNNNMPQPTPDVNTVMYHCGDQELRAEFSDDAEKVELFFTGKKHEPIVLNSVVSGSGAKFSDGKIIFWEHQGATYLQMDGEESATTMCTTEGVNYMQ